MQCWCGATKVCASGSPCSAGVGPQRCVHLSPHAVLVACGVTKVCHRGILAVAGLGSLLRALSYCHIVISHRGLLAAAGAGCLLRVLLYEFRTLSNGFRAYFLAPHGVGHINLKQYGSWAGVCACMVA